jgi:hypothetical protein
MRIKMLFNIAFLLHYLFDYTISTTQPEIKIILTDTEVLNTLIPIEENPNSNYAYYQLEIPNILGIRENSLDLVFKVQSTKKYESYAFPNIFVSLVRCLIIILIER